MEWHLHPIINIKSSIMKTTVLITFLTLISTQALFGQVIDVHLHSYTAEEYSDRGGLPDHYQNIPSPKTSEEHLKQTIAEMDKNNIQFAVVSGTFLESVENYTNADSRFIPGYMEEDKIIPIEKFEELVKNGKIRVFGEITGVYFGKTLNDPLYAPYLEVCVKYDIPVAYHTGGGPPMVVYGENPELRIKNGDPLLIEDVLVKYPKLRIYLMHGGEMYYEHALRMMHLYQQLYVDVGVLLWAAPMAQDYGTNLLKKAKEYEMLDRVMFGTDQMVWPGAISKSIEFLNSMDFLTEKEKRMILYDNAKTFLKIE